VAVCDACFPLPVLISDLGSTNKHAKELYFQTVFYILKNTATVGDISIDHICSGIELQEVLVSTGIA